jgi:hypothetical protein
MLEETFVMPSPRIMFQAMPLWKPRSRPKTPPAERFHRHSTGDGYAAMLREVGLQPAAGALTRG